MDVSPKYCSKKDAYPLIKVQAFASKKAEIVMDQVKKIETHSHRWRVESKSPSRELKGLFGQKTRENPSLKLKGLIGQEQREY